MNAKSPDHNERNDIVVFSVRRDTQCAECGEELGSGRFLRVENDKPLCMTCTDLAHLEFLPSGNTALTRRATKYSPLRAVVVKWSRSRKRYERQGILVTPDAIQKAELECLADEDLRARQRARAAERREVEDAEFIAQFTDAVRKEFPGCPSREAQEIAAHACLKHSGRVGRSAMAKELDPKAVLLAVRAHIRHVHTRYDELLMETGDRGSARASVRDQVDDILARWQQGTAREGSA